MRTSTATLAVPSLPQVNLLPPEIREARKLGTVKRWVLVSAGVTPLAVGTLAGVAQVVVTHAESQLAEADAETAALLAESQPFTQVVTVRDQLRTAETARDHALSTEILWGDYLGAVTGALPPGVRITSLDYKGRTPITAGEAATADPLVRSGVGIVAFTALAADLPDTAAWADALDAVPGLGSVRMNLVELQHRGSALEYSITGAIQVDDGALAHRFAAVAEDQS